MKTFKSVVHCIEYWAKEKPGQPAVSVADGPSITYAELQQQIEQAAGWLHKQGLQKGDRLVLIDINSLELLIFFYAGFRLGIIVAPLNWKYGNETLAYLMEDSGASLLLYGEGVSAFIENFDYPIKRQSLSKAYKESKLNDPDEQELQVARQEFDETATSLLIYTSGTTGLPKGVCLSQENLMAVGSSLAPQIPDQGSDSNYLVTAFQFHLAGCGIMFLGLYKGCHNILMPFFTPGHACSLLESAKIHYSFFAPIMIQSMLDLPGIEEFNFSHLQSIQYGGAPMAKSFMLHAREVFDCHLLQGYGLSETAGLVSLMEPADYQPVFEDEASDAHDHLLLSAGKPLAVNDVCVKDSAENPLESGESGEICVRGKNIFRDYWKKEVTNEAIISTQKLAKIDRDGWFHTGDIGHIDEKGYIYLTDRLDDMIITRGINVHPAEVEQVLSTYPEVKELAIIGLPDEKDGEVICAVLVPQKMGFNLKKFLTWGSEKIAEYQLPKEVRFTEHLPRNPSGKILRRELRKNYS